MFEIKYVSQSLFNDPPYHGTVRTPNSVRTFDDAHQYVDDALRGSHDFVRVTAIRRRPVTFGSLYEEMRIEREYLRGIYHLTSHQHDARSAALGRVVK